jgi:hypothetical protein
MSTTTIISNGYEIVAAKLIEFMYSGGSPWIPQTPDSQQQGSDLEKQERDEEEGYSLLPFLLFENDRKMD